MTACTYERAIRYHRSDTHLVDHILRPRPNSDLPAFPLLPPMLPLLQPIHPLDQTRQSSRRPILHALRQRCAIDLCLDLLRRIRGRARGQLKRRKREGGRVGFARKERDEAWAGLEGVQAADWLLDECWVPAGI